MIIGLSPQLLLLNSRKSTIAHCNDHCIRSFSSETTPSPPLPERKYRSNDNVQLLIRQGPMDGQQQQLETGPFLVITRNRRPLSATGSSTLICLPDLAPPIVDGFDGLHSDNRQGGVKPQIKSLIAIYLAVGEPDVVGSLIVYNFCAYDECVVLDEKRASLADRREILHLSDD
ncbi:pyridoxal phosphate-dependent transferase [Aspergillus affinis]|uniref:pyridoxal phosphate-dependent transferase n=1 Tax=Aspergillus affinis TaxID=1070780 RepID=UPI0022FF17AE|nr:pyridoxal phosphate-dependent transferase [Aspergillus affinis]KAI9038987.1 pyridoxal phosphate-dependent transferase [Aspergillus affinis]